MPFAKKLRRSDVGITVSSLHGTGAGLVRLDCRGSVGGGLQRVVIGSDILTRRTERECVLLSESYGGVGGRHGMTCYNANITVILLVLDLLG